MPDGPLHSPRSDEGVGKSGPTPGPWLLDGTYVYEDDATGRTIADCRRSTRDMGECRANARLIAAAPDLYAVCREVADLLYSKQDSDRVREMAREAIAKAEGRK